MNDPWTAGAFVLGGARDSFRYVVPGGNHGAAISHLPDAQRAEALGVLARWTGVQPPGAQSLQSAEPEDWRIDRQRRLPL